MLPVPADPAPTLPAAQYEASAPSARFVYADTASTRAGIEAVSRKLEGGTVAILGLGGTGSVTLDLISKTPVDRIVLIDGDIMQQHNAFRSPGAMTLEDIAANMTKVAYFARTYSAMHRGIAPYPAYLSTDNLHLLDDVDFVFCCVDSVEARAFIIPTLEARGLPFIDCGLGLSLVDDRLMGLVRVTTSTPAMRAHVHDKGRIPVAGRDDDDIYRSNIQVADLNMLAATLGVIQYKQLRGFYLDTEAEYHAVYSTDGNHIINDDHA